MTGLWLAETVRDAFHGWLPFGLAMTAAFAAAAVRGYTGFGLSALIVASLSMILAPVEIVPCVVLLEIAASMAMLPGLWRQVDWPGLGRLLAGALVGTPPGVALLAYLPAAPMRAGISAAVLAASLGLWRGLTLGRPARGAETVALGGLSGFVNGSTSVGGLPVVLYFLATETAAARARASLVAYLLAVGLVTVAAGIYHGLFTAEVLIRTAAFAPPVLLGLALGQRRFLATRPDSFRRFTLVLLMALALAGLARAAYDF